MLIKRCPATRHGGTWGERRYSSYSYLTSATRWGWVVSVTPRPRFTPGERSPGTHWIGGWVDPRAALDVGAKRKVLCPCRGSNLDHPIVQPVVRHYTAWATAAHTNKYNKISSMGTIVSQVIIATMVSKVTFVTMWSKDIFVTVWWKTWIGT
jgi:hypothetical protein